MYRFVSVFQIILFQKYLFKDSAKTTPEAGGPYHNKSHVVERDIYFVRQHAKRTNRDNYIGICLRFFKLSFSRILYLLPRIGPRLLPRPGPDQNKCHVVERVDYFVTHYGKAGELGRKPWK